ncbi:SRPBCC domain-containing protein [Arenimonas sp.]|uniref:SRPBCC domain-containing protein n=1 Tax=Arenimonas sp. TaxID=1872635 RepID=UPI002E330964|nr:SRPBCC domain-containing protein [Arenimonas sp.]HEX4852590.1 SRPBCC domain-containing protein [Arenimonas sp.]
MFTIDKTLEIEAPAATVWQVLTDFAAYGQWNPFVPECRCELKPGGAIEMQVQLMAKPQFQREFVREVQPGQGFSYSMKPAPLGLLSSFRSHRIEPLGPTRCRYTSHFELRGPMRHLVLALFRGALEKGFAGMSAGVKQRAESLAKR